jgi:hypothetical protein
MTRPESQDSRGGRAPRAVILVLANGNSYSTIETTVPCYRDYINRWRRRVWRMGSPGCAPGIVAPAGGCLTLAGKHRGVRWPRVTKPIPARLRRRPRRRSVRRLVTA